MKKEKRKETEISIYSIPTTQTMLYIATLSLVLLFNPHNSPVRYLTYFYWYRKILSPILR